MISKALAIFFFLISPILGANITQPTFNQGVTAIQARIQAAGGAENCTDYETTDLLAFWAFEDGSGTNVADSASNKTGTAVNTPTWDTGQCGGALTFDSAASEHVTLVNDPVVGVDDDSFSVSFWFKGTDTSAGWTVYSEGDNVSDTPNWFIMVDGTTDGMFVSYRDGSANDGSFATADINIMDGAWHHVVFVNRSTTDREIYVDTVSRGTNTTSVNFGAGELDQAHIAVLGRSTLSDYYDGSIDQLRIYSSVLDATRIGNLFSEQE